MTLFIYENVPFLYRLSYNEKKRALSFLIHSLYLEQINAIRPDNGLIKEYNDLKGFKFEADIKKNFGFNNCSINQGIQDNLLRLDFPIRPWFYFGNNNCLLCDGSGKDKFRDEDCWDCSGTGKNKIKTFYTSHIAHSIYILINYLNFIASSISSAKKYISPIIKPQLLYLQTFCVADMNGHPIGGSVHQSFIKKTFSQDTDSIQEKVQQAMLQVDRIINNEKATPKFKRNSIDFGFNCWIKKDYQSVHIQVPGVNDCCIHLASDGELTCHNLDCSTQQIELLIGLAVVADFVEKAIKK